MRRAVAVLLLALVAAACAWHRDAYWSWPWQGAPVKLTFCGREYERAARPRPLPVREVTSLPLREAHRAPPLIGKPVLVGETCAQNTPTLVFRDAGRDRVIAYGLLGGP